LPKAVPGDHAWNKSNMKYLLEILHISAPLDR
jgi:hypothetical protein